MENDAGSAMRDWLHKNGLIIAICDGAVTVCDGDCDNCEVTDNE